LGWALIKIFKNIFATEVTEATGLSRLKKSMGSLPRACYPAQQMLVLLIFSFYASVLSVNSVAEEFQNLIDPGRAAY